MENELKFLSEIQALWKRDDSWTKLDFLPEGELGIETGLVSYMCYVGERMLTEQNLGSMGK